MSRFGVHSGPRSSTRHPANDPTAEWGDGSFHVAGALCASRTFDAPVWRKADPAVRLAGTHLPVIHARPAGPKRYNRRRNRWVVAVFRVTSASLQLVHNRC